MTDAAVTDAGTTDAGMTGTGMTFEFGIFDSFDLGDATAGQVIARRLDFAVAAERAGIAHYHVTEHHGTPLSACPSPSLFLAALSQRTTTMRIGALVHVLPMYEPLRLAEDIAVLDQLTGGRLDMGVGSGVSPYELGYFGIDAAQARARYAETLKAVTQALTTGRMRHTGTLLRDYDVELSVAPVQRPHPPLWYASSNTATAEWAGANNVNFVGRWNDGGFIPAARAYWDARRLTADASVAPAAPAGPVLSGTVPRIGTAAHVYIGRTDAEAVERFRKANDVFARQLLKLWHDNGNHNADHLYDTDRTMANGNSLVGSAETVAGKLVAQVSQAPVNYFEATLAFGDLTAEEATANLTAFAETVMPAVRAAFLAKAAESEAGA
jgi:alkanesulfonate monooxygenase SsuD/methylene tetrahydromethanopterin reductase-like flavin-dependent oxidoreductase (luciferase family)